jgi:hypothetical protein
MRLDASGGSGSDRNCATRSREKGGEATAIEVGHDLVDPSARPSDLDGQPVLGQAQRLEELRHQRLSGMGRIDHSHARHLLLSPDNLHVLGESPSPGCGPFFVSA